MYVVIMAGGGGTRLWPLSSPERPKPFLPLFPDGTLFEKTVRRLLGPELGLSASDITVVAAGRYASLAREQWPGIGVLVEPEGRNTTAAVALATIAIDRPDDDVMVVLPADHLIGREDVFRGVIRDASLGIAREAFGLDAPLVTLGVQADRAATEYGYLVPRHELGDTIHGLLAYPLERFEEKPAADRAEELRRRPGVAWNAGMFLWQRRAIRAALGASAPDIEDAIERGLIDDRLADAYARLPSISIDYAVMEPAAADGLVVMGAMDVGWSDLGSWTALLDALGLPGIEAEVAKPGETVGYGPDDLTVERVDDRVVAVAPGGHGTMTAHEPIALLRGARPYADQVDELLDRCSRSEG